MELRQIQYFICLYNEGTVTNAAKRLNIVQPALSMQIAKLEDELGQKLFDRTPRGMIPTNAGKRMYQLFFPIMREISHARNQLMQKDGELSGHVNVGIIASIAKGVLADTLEDYNKAHHKVSITVADGYSTILADWVAGNKLDAAIINKPRRPFGLNIEHIMEEELSLIVNKEYHQDLPQEIPFRTLPKFNLVLPTRRHGLRSIIESFAQGENVDFTPEIETDSITSILKFISKTSFATILPKISITNQKEYNGLKCHSIVEPKPTRQVVCVTHPRRQLNQESSEFISIITKKLQDI